MANRKEKVHFDIMNDPHSVQCKCDIIEMIPRRDAVIGRSNFKDFGYNISGVPALPNHLPEKDQDTAISSD